VLDERAMPATDYLMPDGLEWNELAQLLAPLGSSPALAGLSLGCLNPEKDPKGATPSGPARCSPARWPLA
jgi:arginase